MNDGFSNGTTDDAIHHVICSLSGVIRYDHHDSGSGSGKIGTLCLCHSGISLCLSGFEEANTSCLHINGETDFFASLPSIKTAFLSTDGKSTDFAEVNSFDDAQPDRLILYCKDFREISLHLPRKDNDLPDFLKNVWHKLYQNIELCQNVETPNHTSSYSEKGCIISSFLDKDSWENEIVRMKINCRKVKWKIMENKNFKCCEMIGPYSVVPNSISSDSVTETGVNHNNNRYMTWCWTDSETMVSLLRCSEPKTILNNAYLNKILATVNSGRAKTHAVFSSACLRDSCPDEEQIGGSFDKLWNACILKDSDYFYKNLESSKWLHHIQSFIRASRHIARTLKCDKNPVVVIDPTGRDVSCLVVSIVLILCDRYYRTIVGFANLINKEWIAAGYPFRSMLMSIKKFLPTFIMFLDCVHNIILQYPAEFEFTELYLIQVLEAIFSGDSELFKFNCPRDMSLMCQGKENSIVENFWTDILKTKSTYRNPLFDLKDRILNMPKQPVAPFDEESHRTRAASYLYAVSKGVDKDDESKARKRRSTMMFKAIKKPNLHLFHKNRKKSKVKKEKFGKVGAPSFFIESEPPRERLTSIKNIFKSKFDPINVNYSMINIMLWERYYFRHSGILENLDDTEILLNNFVNGIKLSCSEFMSSQYSEDSSDHDECMKRSLTEPNEHDGLQRSDSLTTIASDKLERSIHVSEIDLCNDHVDKDYESAEELSLNGLENSLEGSLNLQSVPISEVDKRLSHVVEEPEMSNSKSPLTVELEIAEATNDIHDI